MDLSQINSLKESVINIGVPTHIGTFYFVKYLRKFNDKFPNIKVNIINKKCRFGDGSVWDIAS